MDPCNELISGDFEVVVWDAAAKFPFRTQVFLSAHDHIKTSEKLNKLYTYFSSYHQSLSYEVEPSSKMWLSEFYTRLQFTFI